MDSRVLETLITLTPLGAPHRETPRVFAITPVKAHVDVGRASKNESKGLIAAKDNAWFDSPIMSRQHARFTASVGHKEVFLRDNGSTHGTSVGNRRLQPKVDYTLTNDEIITFGVRVTSGELSYPAREFRINFERRPWSPESPLSSSIQKRPESIKFQVPDEDNDSVSDQYREDSVQAVEFARAYSVPSSEFDVDSEEEEVEDEEDEEEEEEEEEGEEGEEEEEDEEDMPPSTPQSKAEKPLSPPTLPHEASRNLGTTPEHPIEVWAEPDPAEHKEPFGSSRSRLYHRLTKVKYNDAGSSDMNPIDLEGEVPNSISDQGSENEGPEILSSKNKVCETIKVTLPPAMGQILTSKPSGLCSYSNTLHCSDQHKERESAVDRDGVSDDDGDAVQSKVHSQADVAIPMQESGQAKPISNSTGELGGFEQDDLGTHNYFPEYAERPFVRGSSRSGPPGLRPSIAFGLREINTTENTPGSAASRNNWSHRISSTGTFGGTFDVSQVTNSDVQRTVPRPPSPSDAALAKNANTTALHGHWPFLKDVPSHLTHNDLPYLPYVREPYQKEVAPWLDTCSVSSNAATCSVSSNQAREGSFFDAPDPGWPRYEDGPFASQIQRGFSPIQPAYSSWWFRQHASSVEPSDRKLPSAAPHRSTNSADNDRLWATESPSSPVTSDHASMNITEESEYHPKCNENHPSRLNIADIVNPLADTSRSLKRKADDMSKDDTDKHDFGQPLKFSQQAPPFEVDTQDADAYFDDAQPRENLVDGEHNLLPGSPIEPIAVPYQDLEVAISQDVTGPASKKRKTSSSSAIGVSRFVSGVVVGLAGAFAAFIATIPMSVQEEALREISKAA